MSDLVHRFTYHKPTTETQRLYDRIRAEAACLHDVVDVLSGRTKGEMTHALIGERCLAFAQMVEVVCPDNRERAQAIDAVAMARMMLNEGLARKDNTICIQWGEQRITEARMLACASVALGVA